MTRVAAVILAAGSSTRFAAAGGLEATKLLAPLGGIPLIRRVALAAVGSSARPIVTVTGHAREAVVAALAGLPLVLAHNEDFASGIASSLRAGIAALPADIDGAIVLLGDMPAVTPGLIDRLIVKYQETPTSQAVAPVAAGRRGNPVLLSRGLFAETARLSGDEGARRLLSAMPLENLVEVPVEGLAASLDVDTPDSLVAARRALEL